MTTGCGCDEVSWRRMLSRRRQLQSGAAAALGLVAASHFPLESVAQDASPQAAGRVAIAGAGPVVNGSFVHPLVEVYGDVRIGHRSFVASNTILYAAAERLVSLGDENNCQDNAYVLARQRDVTFGDMVSIAHQAVIENSTVGDFTFFGFRSRTRNAVVGAGAMIMHNTVVENVTIPANRITPLGARITTQAAADALPELTEANDEFKHEVQEVNLEFVDGYSQISPHGPPDALEGIGPNPITSWNPTAIAPQIGSGAVFAEFVRVVGDVRLGDDSRVGQRTALRADEGTPIVIGRHARIQSRVTFHALKGTRVDVGDNAQIGNGNVIHGPVRLGHNVTTEDDCVVFRAVVEDNVTIRAGATIAGDFTLRQGTIVPEGAVVTTQSEADALPAR